MFQLYQAFPVVMDYLPGPHNNVFSHYDYLKNFMNEEIQNHRKDLDHSNPRDYIDAFIIEMDKVCERLDASRCHTCGL